jgi:hypothetical protein
MTAATWLAIGIFAVSVLVPGGLVLAVLGGWWARRRRRGR